MQNTKLSVFVTTFNNARTLASCLGSVAWADEIVVLDSYSTDATIRIAKECGGKVTQHEFLGYGKQKQLALEHTSNTWVLLLDADEMLSKPAEEEVQRLLKNGPDAEGYELPRLEQVFWRIANTGVRMNFYLRLFDKTKGRMSDMPIHAAPKVEGRVRRLRHPFFHFGETDIHTKVEKVNGYSSGLVEEKNIRREARLSTNDGRLPAVLLYPQLHIQTLFSQWLGRFHSILCVGVLCVLEVREALRVPAV